MKKILGIMISFSLIIGMITGFKPVKVAAVEYKINCTPAEGEIIPLLSGNMYDFVTNYKEGIIDNYFSRWSSTCKPAPLKVKWNKVGGASVYYVRVGMKEDLSDATTVKSGADNVEIYNLYAGRDYYYDVETFVGSNKYSSGIIKIKTQDLPRVVHVDNVQVTRDIGGYMTSSGKYVKQGAVYRGARLDEINEDGKNTIEKTLKIKAVVDLRVAPHAKKVMDNIKYINVRGYQYKGELQREANWPNIKKEIQVFTNSSNYPIYLHCDLGRDRSGTLCFLIEALLGMSDTDMRRDYELSFFGALANSEVADPSVFTKNNYDEMYNYIDGLYTKGTMQDKVTNYMKDKLGVTQTEINQIKNNLLEKTPEPTTVPKTTTSKTVSKPAKVVVKSAKNSKKKSIVVKYNKAANAKGYQVCWSNKKSFAKKTQKFTKSTTYTIKKLKKGKTYYVKVRAYNLNGTTKLFGAFSKTKKVKIKK